MKTYQVMPITPGAASQVCVAGWVAPSGVPTRIGNAAWSLPTFEGTRVPADSMKQRMALALTTDIRGVVVFDDGVSGSRKWSPPV
jgi:hypothetical protein